MDYQLMKKIIGSIPSARGVSLIYRASRDGFKSENFRERCAD
jgi:hypothetical protein